MLLGSHVMLTANQPTTVVKKLRRDWHKGLPDPCDPAPALHGLQGRLLRHCFACSRLRVAYVAVPHRLGSKTGGWLDDSRCRCRGWRPSCVRRRASVLPGFPRTEHSRRHSPSAALSRAQCASLDHLHTHTPSSRNNVVSRT